LKTKRATVYMSIHVQNDSISMQVQNGETYQLVHTLCWRSVPKSIANLVYILWYSMLGYSFQAYLLILETDVF
jgi:hypothetical protein